MNYKDVILIAELGLKGDKKGLLTILKKVAAEESNKNRYSSYSGLIDLVEKYSSEQNIESSSLSNDNDIISSFNQSEKIKDIWISKRTEHKLSSFIKLHRNHKNNSSVAGKLNKLLMYGPPGTGKTTLGFYIANKLNYSINYVKVSDVMSSRFGETMKNIAEIFRTSKADIIFIDEFDAFAKKREDSNDVGELKRIVNSLIQTLDFYARGKIVIVATNLVETLDPAIMRRFPFRILIDELNKEETMDFFKFLIDTNREVKFKVSDRSFTLLMKAIYGLNLRTIDSIEQFIEKTLMIALIEGKKEVTIDDFAEILLGSDYLNAKRMKEIKELDPKILQWISKSMLKKGYSKSDIASMIGIHRNSYRKYAK